MYQYSGMSYLVFLAVYAFVAYCVMTIANKLKTTDSWMAWVPILDIFLMLKMAGKPAWWLILLLIPLVNLVISIIVWMEIARRRGFQSWLGILLIIPLFGLLVPAYLAFSEPPKAGAV